LHVTKPGPGAAARTAGAGLALALALAAAPAFAQPHELTEGGYVLRSSAVPSVALAPAIAQSHGVVPRAGTGVLDVSVYRSGSAAWNPLPAQVQASVTDLTGVKQAIEMKAARTDGYVSYYGTFGYLPDQELEFVITARPQGSGRELTLRYQDTVRGD
jgi:hypothetical protein